MDRLIAFGTKSMWLASLIPKRQSTWFCSQMVDLDIHGVGESGYFHYYNDRLLSTVQLCVQFC
jgi:hypothetical protein